MDAEQDAKGLTWKEKIAGLPGIGQFGLLFYNALKLEGKMLRKNLLKVGLGILFVISLTSTVNALTYSDGTFNDADWRLDVVQLGTGGDGSSTATASQQLSDGNPGAYRRILNTLNTGGGLIGYHFFKNSEYNPSLQGEITSIDFSYDHKMFLGFGEGQSTSFSILQGGLYFMCGPGTWANQAAWETLSATGLIAESFGTLSNPAIHPDFSTSGGPILFGFHTANGGNNYSITVGIDNWSVNLHTSPVPLPGAVVLFGSGLVRLAIYRRRKLTAKN